MQSPNLERISRALSIPLAMVATSTPDEMMCIMSYRLVLYNVLLCRVALQTYLLHPKNEKKKLTGRYLKSRSTTSTSSPSWYRPSNPSLRNTPSRNFSSPRHYAMSGLLERFWMLVVRKTVSPFPLPFVLVLSSICVNGWGWN